MYTIGFDFGDTVIQLKELSFAVRLFTEQNAYAPDPDKVTIVETNERALLTATGLSWAGNQEKAPGEIQLEITLGTDGRYVINARGSHGTEVCKSILVQVFNLNLTSMQFDENNKTVLNVHDYHRDIKAKHYPINMKMPLAFIEDHQQNKWFALSKDNKVRLKGFASHFDPYLETQVLDLAHEEDKRYRTNEIVMPPWHLGCYEDVESIILERCEDLENNFNLVPFRQREDTPAWLEDIKLVTILHGEHWTGHVFNTFADMEKTLKSITEKIDGKHVLAFLPGWDGRYYYNYPEYEPSARMGGKEGFKGFVQKAHELGVKVVPMLGANNANIEVMKKLGLEDAVIKDAWGLEQRCDWVDWDYDLSTENNCMLANMGHPGYLQHMIERSKYLIETYKVDGIFLDISFWWANDPHYSPYEGLVSWAKEMKKNRPDLLLFGENSYDALWGVFSMFHEKGFPAGHGSALYRYAVQTHYLAYPAPGMGSGGIHEFAWKENGQPWERHHPELIPTLSIVQNTIQNHPKAVENIIKQAKAWKQFYPGVSNLKWDEARSSIPSLK
ncbi:DUF6259 domain-containing protein [Mesobacillus foraminis]|uniref:DUF6259 domain-containing protein n=1 Tax=Mesobacillus foraminis TaxID=279826 RepID=A0A4R2B6Z7_9BACI|nr:DUF6259 domain-containing protein [Mesobacillus foraminis]TCN21159.1 hypothetical protein EV146_11383 [Mesobacillus foraminis]